MGKRNSIILKILVSFLEYENTALRLPEGIVALLWIQQSLLNFSYILQYNKQSWTYILVLLARPSIILSLDYLEYIVIGYLLLWLIFFFFQNNFGASLINLINDLLKVSLLNFILESMTSTLGFAIGMILCLQQLLDLVFLQGTLSVITKNFQVPIINILSYFRFIFNLLLVYLNQFGYSSLLIQFLGITSSVMQFLETVLYNQYRSQQLRNYIGFIQISTIFLGILRFITIEFKYSIVLIPLILKMFQNKPLPYIKETDPIILASIELQKDNVFECFQLISNLENQNIIRLAKSQLLQKQYAEKISIKIQSQQSNITSLNGVCKQLIENDHLHLSLSENLNKLIEMKLKVFLNYKSISFLQTFEFVKQASIVQQKIEESYKSNYCSTMIQSLYVFFYSEIQNNFVKAQEIQNSLGTTVESQIKFHDSQLQKLIYIIYNYQHNKLTVKQISSNAPKSFYSKQVDDLVPDGISEWHSCLVNQFIIHGRSKFIRNFNQNFIVNGQYLENIQFAIDIIYNGDLDFVCLIQPTVLQSKIIVVNQNYIITALSEELSEFQSLSMYFRKGIQVSKFIPKITQITESCYVENMIVIHSDQIKSANNLHDQDTEINYFCDVQIEVNKLKNQIIYMIIQFDNFKRLLTKKNDEILKSDNSIQDIGKSIPNETEQSGITEPYEFNEEEEHFKVQTYQYKYLTDILPNPREKLFSPRDDEVSLVKFERKTKRFKSQFKKSQFQEEQIAQINEVQSQVSSLKMFRNSKFYRKYDLYDKYINHIPYEKLHKLIIALIVVTTFSQLSFIIIQLSDVSLVQLADDIELLKIKNLLFQPLEVFLVTRWTLFNYKNMLTEKQMTQQDYNIKQQFARSNLDLGYDQLNINIESVLFKSQLQPELQNKYINAYQYLDTYKNEQYNITLRGAISILTNFQYTLKMNYVIERTVGIDTPQVFYSYKNYKLLNDITTELNKDVEISTLQRGDLIISQVQTIFLLQQLYLIILLLIIIILDLIINKRLMLSINFKQFVQDREIELEIEKLKLLYQQINADMSVKFSYKLDIEIKEQQFQSIENTQILGKFKQKEKNRITNLFFFIYLLLFYLFFTSNSVISFYFKRNFLLKYSQTTSYMIGFSNLGIDVPCMFAQREILYGRDRLMYLTQTDFDYLLQRIQTALYNTIQFGELDFDFNQILVTEKFLDYYYHMQFTNLCEHIPENIQEKSLQLCSQIFNSNMKLGLKAILIQIQNLISTEMEINKFVKRNSTTPNELEGVFILSQIIKQINEEFFYDLKDLTQNLVQTVYIINVVCMLIVILFGIFWIKSFALQFLQHSKNIIQIIQTIPSYSLFNNDTFERALRSQINKN